MGVNSQTQARRVAAVAKRMTPTADTQISELIAVMEPLVDVEIETGRPQPLPIFYDEQEAIIDEYARRLPEKDQTLFAGFMATGDLPDNPSPALHRALHAELLHECSLALRVGEAPARKQNRGWT